jgi:hypothetical protein
MFHRTCGIGFKKVGQVAQAPCHFFALATAAHERSCRQNQSSPRRKGHHVLAPAPPLESSRGSLGLKAPTTPGPVLAATKNMLLALSSVSWPSLEAICPEGGATPPLKTALRVRFDRLTPQGAAAPRQSRFPPLICLSKRRQLAVVCHCPSWRPSKYEVCLKNGKL